MKSVLVVDDEPTIVEVVCRYLNEAGYATRSAATGHEALALVDAEQPDLVVLDIILPGVDGLQVMRRIRQRHPTAVILLSAKGSASDRVAGLRLGADDYMPKPFVPAELVARVGAVLRRVSGAPVETLIECDGMALDPAARTATLRGRDLTLTPREFDLLTFLALHPGRAFSKMELLDAVWPDDYYTESSTVPVHVRRLRLKIEEDPARPTLLKTIWGVGYRFDP